MDEQAIIEKLRRIEALFAGTKTEGESAAAASALDRMRSRLQSAEAIDPPKEYRFSTQSEWSRRLLVALLRRYNIRPYRYHGQRYTTVMAKVSRRFVDETLWPEFCELDKTLTTYLEEVTNRVIREAVHGDVADAEEREQPQLPGAT